MIDLIPSPLPLPSTSSSLPVNLDLRALTSHLSRAFISAEYSDLHLSCSYHAALDPNHLSTFNLHSIIISQSPLLRSLLNHAQSRPPVTLSLDLSHDYNLTPSALNLSLLYLYSPEILSHLNTQNAASVLAMSCFLGIELLANEAAELCSIGIGATRDPYELESWLNFLLLSSASPSPSPSPSPSSSSTLPQHRHTASSHSSSSSSISSPHLSSHASIHSNGHPPNGNRNVNGNGNGKSILHRPSLLEYHSSNLLQTLLERVIVQLPVELGAFTHLAGGGGGGGRGGGGGQEEYIEIFKNWPFESFKKVIESLKLPVTTDMDRFNFAKRCVGQRKKVSTSTEFEESVVLGFGAIERGKSSVTVLRRRGLGRGVGKT